MEIYLHIHHLDPGHEEIEILNCLKKDGITPKYEVESATDENNSILVLIGDFKNGNIENKIEEVLTLLSNKTIETISNYQLDISLRLVVEGDCAFFNSTILNLAGKKGIQLYVSNWHNSLFAKSQSKLLPENYNGPLKFQTQSKPWWKFW